MSDFRIKDINLFHVDDGDFSADVRIEVGADEFSIQLGTDGEWSFAPEAETSAGLLGFFAAEYRNVNAAAAGMASLVDADSAVETAKANPKNWN